MSYPNNQTSTGPVRRKRRTLHYQNNRSEVGKKDCFP
jgi:hypothetical protein